MPPRGKVVLAFLYLSSFFCPTESLWPISEISLISYIEGSKHSLRTTLGSIINSKISSLLKSYKYERNRYNGRSLQYFEQYYKNQQEYEKQLEKEEQEIQKQIEELEKQMQKEQEEYEKQLEKEQQEAEKDKEQQAKQLEKMIQECSKNFDTNKYNCSNIASYYGDDDNDDVIDDSVDDSIEDTASSAPLVSSSPTMTPVDSSAIAQNLQNVTITSNMTDISSDNSTNDFLVYFSTLFSKKSGVSASSLLSGKHPEIAEAIVSFTTSSLCNSNDNLIITLSLGFQFYSSDSASYMGSNELIVDACQRLQISSDEGNSRNLNGGNNKNENNIQFLKIDDNTTVLSVIADTSSLMYVEEKSLLNFEYLKIGVLYKVLQTPFQHEDLQEEAQNSVHKAISAERFGDGNEDSIGIIGFAALGNEPSRFPYLMRHDNENLFVYNFIRDSPIRIIGVSILVLALFTFGTLCLISNYFCALRDEKEIVFDTEKGVEQMLEIGDIDNFEETICKNGVMG